METRKNNLLPGSLDSLVLGKNFTWHIIPSDGTAWCILLGVVCFVDRKFSFSATVINKVDGFSWHLVVVYGTAYAEFKLHFLAELHDVMEHASLPICVCGDFNLVRDHSGKNNGEFQKKEQC